MAPALASAGTGSALLLVTPARSVRCAGPLTNDASMGLDPQTVAAAVTWIHLDSGNPYLRFHAIRPSGNTVKSSREPTSVVPAQQDRSNLNSVRDHPTSVRVGTMLANNQIRSFTGPTQHRHSAAHQRTP